MAIDKIGSKALTDCSVVAADIAPGTITGTQLAGSIANAKLANNTVTINGTSVALGASASIAALAWQSVVVSDGSTVTTMVAGRGYFLNNSSAAGIVKLPASASAGDTIAIKDYAGNFGTNNLTIQRNSHNIQGVANDSLIQTNRASVQLVYIDATKGWLFTNESNLGDLQNQGFISATGGTVTTSGNFKIHSFTGDGNFVVASTGFPAPNNLDKVDYVVVAGGGGGAANLGGGGGAGGFRESSGAVSGCYTRSPLGACVSAIAVTAQTYPITVGGGGTSGAMPQPFGPNINGGKGSNSVFSTITSTGGGGGSSFHCGPTGPSCGPGEPGGSGGGGGSSGVSNDLAGGNGNTPPVSPPQGNNGGQGNRHQPTHTHGGGGGGATAVGYDAGGCGSAGPTVGAGGAGATTHITGSPVAYAGGGGGANNTTPTRSPGGTGGGGRGGSPDSPGSGVAGTANTGGGGGASGGPTGSPSGAGGKGIVILRYKFQ